MENNEFSYEDLLSFLKTNVVESLGVSLEMNINIFSEILSKKRKLRRLIKAIMEKAIRKIKVIRSLLNLTTIF